MNLSSFIKDNATQINNRDWKAVRTAFYEDLSYEDQVIFIKALLKQGIDLEGRYSIDLASGIAKIQLTFDELGRLYDKDIAPYHRDEIEFSIFIECLKDAYMTAAQWGYDDNIDDFERDLNSTNQTLYDELVKLGVDSSDLIDAIRAGLREGILVGTSDEIENAALSVLSNLFEGAKVQIVDDVYFTISYPINELLESYSYGVEDLSPDYDTPFLSEAFKHLVSERYSFEEPYVGFTDFDDAACQDMIYDELTAIKNNLSAYQVEDTK